MKTWLIFDCNYLCHRAHHAMGFLEHRGQPTGVIYGVLRDINHLTTLHNTPHVAFAFDSHKSFRRDNCPEYKEQRRKKYESMTIEEKETRSRLQLQIDLLQQSILDDIGYCNVAAFHGYEADDVIASFLITLPKNDRAIIVSGDQDLYQLLRGDRIVIWKPQQQKTYTEYSLAKDYYGIAPEAWVHVKAIAGCNTDGIAGTPGVGDLTAAKYLMKKCPKSSKAFQAITQFQELWNKNLPLVQLPYAGCPSFLPRKDDVTDRKWREVLRQYGIKSLEGPTNRRK